MSTFAHRDRVKQANRAFQQTLSPEEKDDRNDGAFFALLEHVVVEQPTSLSASSFPNIRRSVEQGQRIYPTTANNAYLDDLLEAATDKSDKTNTAQVTTCVDFLFNLQSERVHLLSNERLCHVAYVQIVQAITGICETDYFKRRKLLNGMQRQNHRRMNDSGVKHSKFNKLYLKMQDCYFDSTPPALIIFPLLSLDAIKGWDGVSCYSGLVLPCGVSGETAASEVLPRVRETCSELEIRTAVTTLGIFLKDIAESLLDTENDVLEEFNITGADSKDRSVLRGKQLVRHLRQSSSPTILVPALKPDINFRTIRVAKGTFDYNETCLPDPFLLALKGAINFSSHVGTMLLPACPLTREEH